MITQLIIHTLLKNLFIFSLVSLIWIFFRALSFDDSILMFIKLIKGPYLSLYIGNISSLISLMYGLLIALSFDIYIFKKDLALEEFGSKLSTTSFILISTFILINIVLFFSSSSNFIYFQF
tara:strand:- start:186 stop:548 length:363 start_codon:yes stop_codon:yes gene_type:complete